LGIGDFEHKLDRYKMNSVEALATGNNLYFTVRSIVDAKKFLLKLRINLKV